MWCTIAKGQVRLCQLNYVAKDSKIQSMHGIVAQRKGAAASHSKSAIEAPLLM